MNTPLVSVILRTQNRPQLLKEALESVIAQTHPFIEIIVVNDGGEDVSSLLETFKLQNLIYLAHSTPLGRSAAANTGLNASSGDFILFLDDDDILLPKAIEILVYEAIKNPEAALVYGKSLAVIPKKTETELVRVYGEPFDPVLLHFYNYIPMGSFIVRRKYCKEIAFDKNLHCLEDWDFLLQLVSKGKFIFVDRIIHIYRLFSQGFSINESSYSDREIVWKKLYKKYLKLLDEKDFYHLYKKLHQKILYYEHERTVWQRHYFDLIKKHYQLIGIHEKTTKEKSQEIDRLQKEKNFLNSKLQDLIKANKELRNSLKKKSQEIDRLQKEKNFLNSKLQDLIKANKELRNSIAQNEAILTEIYSSLSWKIITKYRNILEKICPPGTKRFYWYLHLNKGIKLFFLEGPIIFTKKAFSYMKRTILAHDSSTLTKIPRLLDKQTSPSKIKLSKTEKPEVSIIIPVYNNIELTLNCLHSIAQNTPNIYEVIVIDDNSKDATPKILPKIKNLTYIKNQENLGFVESINKGAKYARGKYLVFLNNDTIVTPGWLEALLKPFKIEKKVGACGAKLLYPDGKLQEAGSIVFNDASGWNYGKFDNPSKPEYNYIKEVDYCSGACLVIPKDLFQRVGGFKLLYKPAYFEDTDLAFELRSRGYKVIYQPKATIIHLEGASCGRNTNQGMKKYQIINQKKFYKIWKNVLKSEHFPPNSSFLFVAREKIKEGIILIADHYVPMFDKDAGSNRMFNLIKILKDLGYKIIFWPDNLASLQPYTEILQEMGIEVIYGPEYHFKKYLENYARFIDLVWACRVRFAGPYIKTAIEYNIKTVFDTIDLHFLREEREAILKNDPHLLKKAQETKKMELSLARAADKVAVVSPVEKEILQKEGLQNVILVPNIHEPSKGGPPFEEREGLLFVGSFQHPPNEDAVLWFVKEILPYIKKKLPEIRFYVVGAYPTKRILALNSPEIVVTGYVADIAPFFQKNKVFVAPLRYGAGLKGKVGQALSFGLPSVLTSVAAEGMLLENGKQALIADDKTSFAEAVIQLYQNKSLWEKISISGRTHIETHFSQRVIKNNLKNILKDLISEPKFKKYKKYL